MIYGIRQLIASRPAALAILSSGGPLPPVEIVELCATKGLPFVTIGQSNSDRDWYTDDVAARYRVALAAASRCYFVSRANLQLAERQIGTTFPNAEVIWNPVNISRDISLPWPASCPYGQVRFACVGRLHPPSKGQDLLFEAFSAPEWKNRDWRLTLYGEGPMRQSLERLAHAFGLTEKIVFAGFASVRDIWTTNHALVMPSRFEGLPLAMVEAMLCARPVIATNVAGHPEIVEDGMTGFLADAPTARSMAYALERFWARRHEAEEMGKAGLKKIRTIMPSDPIRVLSDQLLKIATS